MIIQIPQSLSVIGLLILLISYSSCKQELAPPVSKASLGYYSNNGNEQPNKVITLSNGNTVIVGVASDKAFLLILSPQHQKVGYTTVTGLDKAVYTDVIETSDGNILALGTTEEDIAQPVAISILTKFSQSGQLKWSIDTALGNYIYYSLTALSNGNVLLSGKTSKLFGNGIITEIDMDGQIVWSKTYHMYNPDEGWTNIENTNILPNGNYLLTATGNSETAIIFWAGVSQVPGSIHLVEVDKNSKNIVKQNSFGYSSLGNIKSTKILPFGISVWQDESAVIANYSLDSLRQKKFDIVDPKSYQIDKELYVIGGNIMTGNLSDQASMVMNLNKNLSIEWISAYGYNLNPKKAIHLSKKEGNLEVLFTYYDTVLENIAFGFYIITKNGEIIE